MNKEAVVFPKLFLCDACVSFKNYLKKNNYNYNINYISTYDELISLIQYYGSCKNYSLPLIISDISYLDNTGQSVLLKFMDDTKLKLILLASRDNILNTIISRSKVYRKLRIYRNSDKPSFMNISKARNLFLQDISDNIQDNDCSDIMSQDDTILTAVKYNPLLSYNNFLVKSFTKNEQTKLLNLIEYSNE